MDLQKLFQTSETLHAAFRDLDETSRSAALCELIDYAAGMEGRKGYELIEELLLMMHEVGDMLGVHGGDNVSEQG